MRRLILGDPVVTMAPGAPVLEDGALLSENGTIVAVGPREQLAAGAAADVVLGGDGCMVLPGLVNAHHHAGSTFRAGLVDLPFERRNISLHLIHPRGSEDEVYDATAYSCAEMLRGGVTAVVAIFYPNAALDRLGADAALQAYLDSGIRVAFGVAQRDRNLYVHEHDDAFLARLPEDLAARVRASGMGRYSARSLDNDEFFRFLADLHDRWHGREDRVAIEVAPDWYPAASDELLVEARRVATEREVRIQLHLLETRYEMLLAFREHGKSAVAHLDDLGVLGPDVVCAHSVWLTRDDAERYAANGVVAVHNPASNLRLASGIAPVRELLARGVHVAFGSDGLAAADDNSMLEDLRLGGLLQRRPGIRSEPLDALTLIGMATRTGARAAGLEGRAGTLEAGCAEDVVVVDTRRMTGPAVAPPVAMPELLIARGRTQDVRNVVIAGREVVSDGAVTTVDVDAVASRLRTGAQEAAARWEQGEAARALVRDVEPYLLSFYDGWDDDKPHDLIGSGAL
jgi:5-methylthioadenosine/S-adenosylhomocysteine deaminase